MGFMMYIFAALFLLMGVIRLCGKIFLLKGDYQQKLKKASDADRKNFLKWNGILTMIVGAAFLVAGILGNHWEEKWYWVVFLVPVGIGFLGLASLNKKYF